MFYYKVRGKNLPKSVLHTHDHIFPVHWRSKNCKTPGSALIADESMSTCGAS